MAKQISIKHFRLSLLAGLITASLFSPTGVTAGVTLDDILKSGTTDALSCAAFKVRGFCVWIKCTLVYCTTTSNAYIEHYTPDAIVTVYDQIGRSPESTSGQITKAMSGVFGATSGAQQERRPDNSNQRSANHYRIADVYGSPAAYALTELLGQLEMASACETTVTPYMPYFVSSTNPLFWNSGLADSLLNPIDSATGHFRYIGERQDGQRVASTRWGWLYPRVGVVTNHDHYKASATIAQRAMDIVFNGTFGIYNQNLGDEEKPWYKPTNKIDEWSTDEGKWQMLYPRYQSTCHVMGDVNLKNISGADSEGWSDFRSTDGDYAWHYWRRYECCKQPSGYSFLFKVRW
jgi:integrating conjugative element protein (TIGR03756 family)